MLDITTNKELCLILIELTRNILDCDESNYTSRALLSPIFLQTSCSLFHENGSDNPFQRHIHSKFSQMAYVSWLFGRRCSCWITTRQHTTMKCSQKQRGSSRSAGCVQTTASTRTRRPTLLTTWDNARPSAVFRSASATVAVSVSWHLRLILFSCYQRAHWFGVSELRFCWADSYRSRLFYGYRRNCS